MKTEIKLRNSCPKLPPPNGSGHAAGMAGKASAPHAHSIDAQLARAGLTREPYALASAIGENEVEYRKNSALLKDEHRTML